VGQNFTKNFNHYRPIDATVQKTATYNFYSIFYSEPAIRHPYCMTDKWCVKRCIIITITIILRNSRNVLATSVAFYLDRLQRYRDLSWRPNWTDNGAHIGRCSMFPSHSAPVCWHLRVGFADHALSQHVYINLTADRK